jgi:hypothetical protein
MSYHGCPIHAYCQGNPTSSKQKGRRGYEFLRPLVEGMMRQSPTERITMQEALEQFDATVAKLGVWKLRSRSVRVTAGTRLKNDFLTRIQTTASHWTRKVKYTTQRLPPMPPNTHVK